MMLFKSIEVRDFDIYELIKLLIKFPRHHVQADKKNILLWLIIIDKKWTVARHGIDICFCCLHNEFSLS